MMPTSAVKDIMGHDQTKTVMAEEPPGSEQSEHGPAVSESRQIQQAYPYQPLHSPDHIRLVYIEPGEGEEPISCHLRSDLDLNDPPVYWAISYCWLVGTGFVTLRCGHHELTVQTTIHQLLKRLRKPDAETVLWIDAICINQSDNSERSSQVQMMGKIYQSAEQVIAWVGEEDESTHKVASILDQLNHLARQSVKSLNISGVEQFEWPHLIQFIRRPWFSRKWVLQEVCLAQRCTLRCGSFVWDWSVLQNIMRLIRHSQNDTTTPVYAILQRGVIDFCTTWSDRKSESQNSLQSILDRSRGTCTSQKLDEIYAILPLAKGNSGMQVNYESSTIEVFGDVAKRILDRIGLAILNYSVEEDRRRRRDLPSWMPDWTGVAPTYSLMNADNHRALRTYEVIRKEFQILGDQAYLVSGRTLQTKLLDGDGVDVVRQPWPDDEHSGSSSLVHDALSLLRQWYHTLENTTLGQKNTYRPTGESQTSAFAHTLIAGHYEAKYFDAKHSLAWDDLCSSLKDLCCRSETNLRDEWNAVSWPRDVRLSKFHLLVKYYCRGRTFFTSKNGRMGLGPASILPSDGIFMSHELLSPIVMRRTPTGKWNLVGECYLHGWDRGELLTRPHESIEIE